MRNTKNNIPEFERTNLQYETEYDYDRSECTCNAYERGDYCRCTTIEHAWIERIYLKDIIAKLYQRHCADESEMNEYGFDRLCSIFKLWDKGRYEVETCGGYYGEEIDGVYFTDEEKLVAAFKKFLLLPTDIDKIKYLLELEYNYLIEKVVYTSSAYITDVPTDKVRLPQHEYFVKLSKEVIEDYRERKLPVAVCIRKKDRYIDAFDEYVLIDGYHRFIANKDSATSRIVVIE